MLQRTKDIFELGVESSRNSADCRSESPLAQPYEPSGVEFVVGKLQHNSFTSSQCT